MIFEFSEVGSPLNWSNSRKVLFSGLRPGGFFRNLTFLGEIVRNWNIQSIWNFGSYIPFKLRDTAELFFRFPVFTGHLPKIIGFLPQKTSEIPVKKSQSCSAVTRNLKSYIMALNFKNIVCYIRYVPVSNYHTDVRYL